MIETVSRILAVGAHPDDIEFGSGGILLSAAAKGSEIALCLCSRGESGSNGTPDEREAEARSAAKFLGATITFLDLGGDCRLEVSAANNMAIARQIRATAPDILLGPVGSPEQHPDHVVVRVIFAATRRGWRAMAGWGRSAICHPMRSGNIWNTRSLPGPNPLAMNARYGWISARTSAAG